MEEFKKQLRMRLPFVGRLWRRIQARYKLIRTPTHQIFAEIYHENKWGDQDTLSGPGSRLDRTEKIRKALPPLIQKLDCRSILDIPCGDYHWMKTVEMDLHYVGADIVLELINANRKQYGTINKEFIQLDVIRDPLPKVDLVFCRDCLIHLSNADIFRAIRNIKASNAKYLLTTTYNQRVKNANILTGEWHLINLQLPPFNFPPPLDLIDESLPLPEYYDKHMGLWKIIDLPDF